MKTVLDSKKTPQTSSIVAFPQTSTTATSVLFQYPQAYIGQTSKPPSLLAIPQTDIATQAASQSVPAKDNTTKPVQASPNAAKVIDLTDDDDSSKPRIAGLATPLTSNQAQQVKQIMAQNDAQLLRPGSYQLVLNGPMGAVSSMRTVSIAATGTSVVQTNISTPNGMQSLLLSSPTNISPGTSLARAAVPLNPASTPVQKVSVVKNLILLLYSLN